MSNSSIDLTSLQNLFQMQINKLTAGETRLLEILPKLSDAVSSSQFHSILKDYNKELSQHRDRLQTIIDDQQIEKTNATCGTMQNLSQELSQLIESEGDPTVKDAALIVGLQQVMHHKMAAYGAARSFAYKLGAHQAVELLERNLEEEGDADRRLSKLADIWVNVQAAHA
jgi:ferritin-like metal-binding protein YciE